MLRHPRCSSVLLVALVTGCVQGADPASSHHTGSRRSDPITNGSVADGVYPEVVKIEMFVDDPTTPSQCTGTLIRADAVLTAAHCFAQAPKAVLVHMLLEAAQGLSVAKHPTLDLAVVRLASSMSATPPAIATQPAAVNDIVDLVGRMNDGDGSADSGLDVFMTTAPISAVDDTFYLASESTQKGDSGGPMARRASAGHVVLGVLFGSALDGANDKWTRVDIAADWINQNADAPPNADGSISSFTSAPSGGTTSTCGAITFDGVCNAETLTYCKDGELQTIPCGDFGGTCGPAGPDTGGFDCIYPQACGDIGFEGQCDGDVLRYCDGGLRTVDCGARGQTCGFSDAEQLFDCL